MDIQQTEEKLEKMHFDSIVKSYCNKVNDIKKLKIENKELSEQLRLHSVSNNMASCMLSILDSLKLYDNGSLLLDNETLSEVMFRKMKAYDIDLNKELGFTHLKPI